MNKNEIQKNFFRAARNGNVAKLIECIATGVDVNECNKNGLNALHLASKEGRMDIIREVLSRGAYVDQATKKGNTALHVASLAGHLNVVEELIKRGANVNKQSHVGFTPLYMAAQENHTSVVSFLLDNGADQSLATEDGFTPMAVAKQQGHKTVITLLLDAEKNKDRARLPELHIAAKKNDCAKIEELLKANLPVNHQTTNGFTALHVAAHYGCDNAVRELMKNGAQVNFQAKNNVTPLHVAAKMGRLSTLQMLLESGAFNQALNGEGFSPLHYACRYNHAPIVDALLQSGASVDAKTRTGLTPLHLTCMGDSIDCGSILINNRANVNETSVDLLTPLHVSAHCGSVGMARLLLDARCTVDGRGLNGFTPLHVAVKKGKVEMMHLLLSYVPDVDVASEDGITPLHIAAFMGMSEIVDILLDSHADFNKCTHFQENVLHLCARGGHDIILKKFVAREAAGVNDRSKDELTPLHLAAIYGNTDVVETLLQYGADVNATTFGELTALHLAAKSGQSDIVAVLVKNGANEGALTEDGLTPFFMAIKKDQMKSAQQLAHTSECSNEEWLSPLHVAVHYNRQEMVAMVLQNGIDPMMSTEYGFTALHFAVYHNLLDVTELLLTFTRDSLSHTALKMLMQERTENGYSALHLAVVKRYIKMVRLLLRFGANPDYEMQHGFRCLHITAQRDDVEIAQELLSNGADTNALSDSGYTCFHVASYWNRPHFVQFLLSGAGRAQVKINAQSHSGMTPLHLAAQQGHLVMVQTLLQQTGINANMSNKIGWTAAQVALFNGQLAIYTLLQKFTTIIENWDSEEKKAAQMTEEGREVDVETLEGELGTGVFKHSHSEEEEEPITRLPPTSSFDDDSIHYTNEYVTLLLEYASPQTETVDSKRMSAPVETYDTLKIFKEDKSPLPGESIVVPKALKAVESAVTWQVSDSEPSPFKKRPASSGFFVSFMVDARGGILRSKRNSKFRILVPPNSTSEPVRVICRLVKPHRFCNPIPMHDGNGFACRIIELSAMNTRFSEPLLFEMPHFASLRARERELIVFRSDNGETWKEHTSEVNESALYEWYGENEIPSASELDKQNVVRIVTAELPTYFAVMTRIRQENVLVGKEGGSINSSTVARVQTVFPEGALQKRIKVGLQAQAMNPDILKHVLDNFHIWQHVTFSPIVTIEPRRRKFHRPITVTIPLGAAGDSAGGSRKNSAKPGSSELRLFCSISGSGTPTEWEDITGSTLLMRTHQDCVNFTTTVSARFWIIECLKNISVDLLEVATRIYNEINRVPYIGSLAVYHRPISTQPQDNSGSEAELRVLCLIDDDEKKTLESMQGFNLIGKSEPVEVIQDQIHQIEVRPPQDGRSVDGENILRPILFNSSQQTVINELEQRIFYPLPVRAFYECRSANIPVTGKFGDVTLWPPGYTMELHDLPSQDSKQPLTKVCLRPVSDGMGSEHSPDFITVEVDNEHEELTPTVYPRKRVSHEIKEQESSEDQSHSHDLSSPHESEPTDVPHDVSKFEEEYLHESPKHDDKPHLLSEIEEFITPMKSHGRECVRQIVPQEPFCAEGEYRTSDEIQPCDNAEVNIPQMSLENICPELQNESLTIQCMENVEHEKDEDDLEARDSIEPSENLNKFAPKSSTLDSTCSLIRDNKKFVGSPMSSLKSNTLDSFSSMVRDNKKITDSPTISLSRATSSQKDSPSMGGSGTHMTVDSDFDMLLDVSDHSHTLLSEEEEAEDQAQRSFEDVYQQALNESRNNDKPLTSSKERLGSTPPSPSRVPRDIYEVIESDPQEKTHIEETEETLPDGTVVKRRIIQKEVSQVITERDYKEHYPSEEDEAYWPDTDEGVTSSPGMSTPMSGSIYHYGSSVGGCSSTSRTTSAAAMDQPQILLAACFQNPPNLFVPGSNATLSSHTVNADEPEEEVNVEEIEEVLPDGTVVQRRVTTRKITQKVTEKFVVEEDLDDDEDYDGTDGEETEEEIQPQQKNIELQN